MSCVRRLRRAQHLEANFARKERTGLTGCCCGCNLYEQSNREKESARVEERTRKEMGREEGGVELSNGSERVLTLAAKD